MRAGLSLVSAPVVFLNPPQCLLFCSVCQGFSKLSSGPPRQFTSWIRCASSGIDQMNAWGSPRRGLKTTAVGDCWLQGLCLCTNLYLTQCWSGSKSLLFILSVPGSVVSLRWHSVAWWRWGPACWCPGTDINPATDQSTDEAGYRYYKRPSQTCSAHDKRPLVDTKSLACIMYPFEYFLRGPNFNLVPSRHLVSEPMC
jgi:hypothetical protein